MHRQGVLPKPWQLHCTTAHLRGSSWGDLEAQHRRLLLGTLEGAFSPIASSPPTVSPSAHRSPRGTIPSWAWAGWCSSQCGEAWGEQSPCCLMAEIGGSGGTCLKRVMASIHIAWPTACAPQAARRTRTRALPSGTRPHRRNRPACLTGWTPQESCSPGEPPQ